MASICMSPCGEIGDCCVVQSLWLIMRILMVSTSSLAAMRAQWMASIVVLWSVWCARPIPFHLKDWACPKEPKILSQLWGE